MLLTLKEIKDQLRIEQADTLEDGLLTSYALAAQHTLQHATGRKFFATKADVPPGCVWWVVLSESEDIKLAMMLLVGHYYLNREATTEASLRQIPLGVKALIGPYVVLFPEIDP